MSGVFFECASRYVATMDHASINRDYWNATAQDWVALGERLWAGDPEWGVWAASEAELQMLPDDMTGQSAVELGCGTGYVSAWMARRGAVVTAIDIAQQQLCTARRLATQHAVDITFIEGNAEATGLTDASFDFAISEYGAAIWCDPKIWLAEAWRILKPGGRLVFLGSHPLALLTFPPSGDMAERQLYRPYRGLGRLDWTEVEVDPGGVEFNLTHADWHKLFSQLGFQVTGFEEIYAKDQTQGDRFPIPNAWAMDFPTEQVWKLQKPA